MRFAPCAKHAGRHLDVHGQCVHPGAPCALKPARCVECGAATMRRLDLQTGEVTTLEAGSDLPHRHDAPIRVELDPDDLAAAIVQASRQARQQRQPSPTPSAPVAVANASQRPPAPRDTERAISPRDIPTVTVWSDDGANPL